MMDIPRTLQLFAIAATVAATCAAASTGRRRTSTAAAPVFNKTVDTTRFFK